MFGMDAAELVELRKQGSISQEEFFVGLNRLRRANNGSSAAVAEASAADLIPGGSGEARSSAVPQQQRCSSSDVAHLADDTARRRRADEADCADGGDKEEVVGSINGPGAASGEIVAQRSTLDFASEPSSHVELLTSPKEDIDSRRGAVGPGGGALSLGEGCDSADVPRIESHRCGIAPHSAPPESTQQHLLLSTKLHGACRMPQRTGTDNDSDRHAGLAGADDDAEWLISPRGEESRQPTSGRRRSLLSSHDTMWRQGCRIIDEGVNDSISCDGSSGRAEARFSSEKGHKHRVSEETSFGRRHPTTNFPWRPEGVRMVPPDLQKLGGSSDSSGSRSLSRSQPAAAPRSGGRDTCGADHTRSGGYSKAEYPLGISPGRTEGGRCQSIPVDKAISVSRPHWRPAGGAKYQPYRRQSVKSNCSSITNGGGRRRSRSLPVTPARSRHCSGGDVGEDDEQIDTEDLGSVVEDLSSMGSVDDRAMASRKGGSPVKPCRRPAGGGDFRPRIHHGDRVGGRCRSQPSTPSRLFSPHSTASTPETLAVGNAAASVAWKQESASVGESERRHHRGVHNGNCRSSAGCPHPCRSPLQGNRLHVRPKTPEEEDEEEEASFPPAEAAAGGLMASRGAAAPDASWRRRRDNLTRQSGEGSTTAEAVNETEVPQNKSRPRGAVISDSRARGGDGSGGGGDASVKKSNTGPPSVSTGGLWRDGSRHRGPQRRPALRAESPRRCRGTTDGGMERDDADRSGVVAVSCDRYGYPLHERECLGSTGGSEGGAHNLRFSPVIKGLPDFYESRPKRQTQDNAFERSLECVREGGWGQPSTAGTSLYERTTEWQARASELRARKLAQREEQELSACTFQPNVPPRGTPGSGGALTAGGPVEESSLRLEQPHDAGRYCRQGICGGDGDDSDGGGTGDGGGVDSGVDRGDGSGGGGGGGGGDESHWKMGEGIDSSAGNKVEEERSSGVSKGSTVSPQKRNVAQRLFEEAGRMDERRFEGQERKIMWEEEVYARTCTFQPSLVQGKFGSTIHVPSRYRDPPRSAPAPPSERRQEVGQETLTFHPKILGVKPGMTRALEYVSLGVTERLYRAHPYGNHDQRPEQSTESTYSSRCPLGGHQPPDDYDSYDDEGKREEGGGYPRDFRSSRSERLGKGRRFCSDRSNCSSSDAGLGGSDRGEGSSWDQARRYRAKGERRRDNGRSTTAAAAATATPCRDRQDYAPPERCVASDWSDRPRSAPAAAGATESLGGANRHNGPRWAEGRARVGEGRARVDRPGGGSWAARLGAGGGDRGEGGCGSQGHPRRQNSISFREFLARQAHSQATAKQHLSRLTAQQSPSFTPQLSRGTRRMVARNGGLVASAGGGRFEDRLNVKARRRSTDRKAALVAARSLEGKACTFVPQVTPRARTARSRSARELSLGDSVLREAKLRMARAREEIRLLDKHGIDNGASGDSGRSFEPTLETAGDDGLAPPAFSRLRLADDLDTYVDRVQEAARQREEHIGQQKRRQQAAEEEACTFQPEMKASRCPDLVKRTAAGMRCIREFRRQQEQQRQEEEAFLSLGSGGRGMLPPTAKPRWRHM